MKRSIVAVIAAVCLFAGNAFALTVEEEIALLKQDVAKMQSSGSGASLSDALGIAIEAGGTVVMQGTNKVNDGSDEGRNDATYSIDLGIGKEFSNGGMAFIHLEAGNGDGLDAFMETYGGVNGDSANSADTVEVTEIWYEQPLFDDKFTVTFGKLNPAGYFDENEFANDETAQFISPMFVNNSVIYFNDNNLGLRMTYSPIEMIDITYAYMTAGWDNIDTNGFNAVQVNVKPFEGANYRAMYWASNEEMAKFEDGEQSGGFGFALSLDQAITETIGVFGRFGWADPSVYQLSMSWSIGAQFSGSMWSRDNDVLGIAAGQTMVSSDFVDAVKAAGGDYKDDSETQAELYYSLAISENLAITPALQYISKPAGGNATVDDDVFVYGIRTQISF